MDPSGDGGGGLTATGLFCGSCGAQSSPTAKFCSECGTLLAQATQSAEYKQVTVLFADVVHSMDIAATVGAERLREIMAELADRCAAVVQRYGGTVDKFTGDGIMAVFGAPVALEDHALRACLAALDIQREARGLATDIEPCDGVSLKMRVGLNSGEVIAGEIGSGPFGYTAVGEQVGMAQRMESVAPPGVVMLSESTARLVERTAVLGEYEMVRIKGADTPVAARRLLAPNPDRGQPGRQRSTLVGRDWELNTIAGLLDKSIAGSGRVVGLVGPPGIGKSRLVLETVSIGTERGVDVFTTYCESHTNDIPFYVATRLLRDVFSISGLEDDEARANIRSRMQEAEPDDLLLLDDLLAISDPDVPLPVIDPAARTPRLTALMNTAAVARTTPAIFVIEDAHWIDQASDAMFGEFAAVVPQTHSLVLVTYRPEYHGALDRLLSSHRIPLAPLQNSDSTALAADLLGPDPSVATFVAEVAERAVGNPFFAEEIVRDLAERGVVGGTPGAYVSQHHPADVRVPASLQAAIAARIDRIGPTAKRTLNAAAVIGLRFVPELLAGLVEDVELSELTGAELIDQVKFVHGDEYAFRHPLIRAVAYESQLKSDRSRLHRKLATAIEERHPESADANAALIAEHLEAAGDLREAFGWHMRAGEWARFRDVKAAYTSWQRAREVADRLPLDDPDRSAMRIAPRVLICGYNFRVGLSVEETGFDELKYLCSSAGDDLSLAIGMAGMLTALVFHNKFHEAARVASEASSLLENAEVYAAAGNAKFQAGEALEALHLAQCVIDIADGDPIKDSLLIGSPLAFGLALRGSAKLCLGLPGFLGDLDDAIAMARSVQDPSTYVATVLLKYGYPINNSVLLPDLTADQETAEALERAERAGDDFARGAARLARGVVLANKLGQRRAAGLELLAGYRDGSERQGNSQWLIRFDIIESAKERARLGDLEGAIVRAREAVDFLFESGEMISRGPAVTVLVESLLQRGAEGDLSEAEAAIERLAAVPTDPGYVLNELPLLRLRALLARAHGDESGYRDFADHYRNMAIHLGFEGHMAIAEAMT
jgi:class 3 adenylate cyclase